MLEKGILHRENWWFEIGIPQCPPAFGINADMRKLRISIASTISTQSLL
jgi:hypothetical protein